MHGEEHEAFELIEPRTEARPILVTCEHASGRLPSPWSWTSEDRWLGGTHWALDIGAADLTRELAFEVGARAVLARFTRLLVDPNRPEGHEDAFRRDAEGRVIALNSDVTRSDAAERVARFYVPYHRAIDELAARSVGGRLLSVHTFTPVYQGRRRELQVGVLFDRDEALAVALMASLRAAGFTVELNEPYSGKEGLMYSADLHGRRHGLEAVEIEVRQDIVVQPKERRVIVGALSQVFGAIAG